MVTTETQPRSLAQAAPAAGLGSRADNVHYPVLTRKVSTDDMAVCWDSLPMARRRASRPIRAQLYLGCAGQAMELHVSSYVVAEAGVHGLFLDPLHLSHNIKLVVLQVTPAMEVLAMEVLAWSCRSVNTFQTSSISSR
ncbi:hypothetical protein NHX12_003209 [Muraenolepis orangiensis]|uniref:Uncharacterized protein n=1 Tax=Muraenolepis orangiensis TaxID=630683 RepID=A0A9Q0DW16_9TELE|nr:hypothetical protein NHX12_003209 [Muraenolepis orangiensis]